MGTWTQLDDGSSGSGTKPGPRAQHAASIFYDNTPTNDPWLVFHGGSTLLGKDTTDVWAFSIRTQKWVQLAAAPSSPVNPWPIVRHGHSIWSAAGAGASTNQDGNGSDLSFYLFAGQHGTSETDPYVGDLWLFSTKWASVLSPSPTSSGNFTQLQETVYHPTAKQPVARALGGLATITGGAAATKTTTGMAKRGNKNHNTSHLRTRNDHPAGEVHGSKSSSTSSVTASPASSSDRLYFGGFSGYTGGLNDLLHNDVWYFDAASGAFRSFQNE